MARPYRLFLLALLCGAAAVAQQAQNPGEPPPAYEVAAIKPNNSGSGSMSIHNSDNTYVASNVSLQSLLMTCYTLQTPAQLIGMPAWAASAHYDLNARIDSETVARLQKLKYEARWEVRRDMLRALLAERFGLSIHAEKRELPVYLLVQAKGGTRLKLADPAAPGQGNMNINNGKMTAIAIDMDRLAYFISGQVQRKVVDKTGLPGKYDVLFEWSRDDSAGSTDAAPSLFTALQEQLGLKLEPTKGPVDVLVIDHIEQPTEN